MKLEYVLGCALQVGVGKAPLLYNIALLILKVTEYDA